MEEEGVPPDPQPAPDSDPAEGALADPDVAVVATAAEAEQVGAERGHEGGDDDFVRGIAMQIAAMSPQFVTRDDVPAEVLDHERHIAELTAKEEGKPEQIIPRIVEGRLGGFFKEVVLLEQPSVQESKKSVLQVLEAAGTTVTRFARFEVGA